MMLISETGGLALNLLKRNINHNLTKKPTNAVGKSLQINKRQLQRNIYRNSNGFLRGTCHHQSPVTIRSISIPLFMMFPKSL